MYAGLLHVITCISNPLRYKSRLALYKQFEKHMVESGVNLTVVECALGDRPFELDGNPLVNHVGVRHHTFTFNKECLIKIGMEDVVRKDPSTKYLAWIDADVKFRNPNWASDTVHALQHFEFVQPWVTCYDLGPNDEHLELHKSFGWIWANQKPILQGPNATAGGYQFAHPGYAWAARRSALTQVGGLPTHAVLGAADHHMAMALIGRVMDSIPSYLSQNYIDPLVRWQGRATKLGMNVGYIPGTIEHGFHGSKKSRFYVERWEILRKHNFDPVTDLMENEYGVTELTGNKPALRMDLEGYFRARNEDSNQA
jgi:hypothetical protein